jgi:hypothetical protein
MKTQRGADMKKTTSKIRGEENYQFANGTKPRGFGHWYFKDGAKGKEEMVIGTYSYAKKWAARNMNDPILQS